MSTYFDRPDGEYYTDVPTNPIASADTWPMLSTNQLIEIQVQLQTKLWELGKNPVIMARLTESIARLDVLINQKILDRS